MAKAVEAMTAESAVERDPITEPEAIWAGIADQTKAPTDEAREAFVARLGDAVEEGIRGRLRRGDPASRRRPMSALPDANVPASSVLPWANPQGTMRKCLPIRHCERVEESVSLRGQRRIPRQARNDGFANTL